MLQPISHILWKIQFFKNFLTIMLLHAKWDVYQNIDLQFGGERSQISNSGDALGVYHHKCSANFSDPSVWPIPVRL
jgi:hypothetical protein